MIHTKWKISVIMPVYNGASYIKKGIQSVLHQTYEKIELIIINDGSRDNSGDIVMQTMKGNLLNTVEIKYIEQENRGVAEARNTGLKAATGDYIMFLDQDDWLENTCIEHLVQRAIEADADEVIGGYYLVSKQGKVKTTWHLNKDYEWSKFRIVAPWGKIFRKAIIDKYHISFLDTKISEDLYFNIWFMSCAKKIEVIPDAGYNWLDNNASESHKNWNKISEDRNPIFVLNQLQNRISGTSYLEESFLTYFFVKYLVWYLLYNAKGNEKNDMIFMYKECFQWLDLNYPLYKKWKITGIHVPKGELLKNRLCVTGCILLHKIGVLLPILLWWGKLGGKKE